MTKDRQRAGVLRAALVMFGLAAVAVWAMVHANGQDIRRIPNSTSYTRGLLETANSAAARAYLEVSEDEDVPIRADTVADLVALGTSYPRATLGGYFARGDGGGGEFILTNTVTSTNMGTRIASASAGYSWDRIYSGPLNVKWFGARGNATADDRTAITNAIAIADITDGHVFFPAGLFRVSSAVAIPTGVSLSGVSFNQYFDNTGSIITNSGSGATFTVTGDVSQANSVPSFIERLKIVGHSGSSHGIHLTDAQMPVIRDSYIYRHGGDGIRISGGIQAMIYGCRMQSNANNIYINSINTTTHIFDCRLEDASASGAAVQINGANDGLITINNCAIESNEGRGVWATGGQVLALRLEDNWFEGNLGAEDVYLQGAAAQFVGDFRVVGNRFNSTAVTTNLRLDYASDGVVTGNLFAQAGPVNFSASANTQDILFLWNRLAGAYNDSGTRVIRQERGVTYEIGVNSKLRSDLDLNNNAVNTMRAVATDATRFVLSATNNASGGGTTSRGFKVKIADNDATDIIAQFHNSGDVGFTVYGDNRGVFDGPLSVSGTTSRVISGSGAPESSVTAEPGSIYMRTAGGAGTSWYVKESGSGNTGWVAYVGTGGSPTFSGVTVSGLTASRLVSTSGGSALASVGDLTSWVAGTANRVTVANDGDGTITLSGPQDYHTGASPTFAGATLSGLTASRLVSTSGGSALASVGDLTSWVAGTANRVTVANDGDGTITLSGPQDLHTGASPTFVTVNATSVSGFPGNLNLVSPSGDLVLDPNGDIQFLDDMYSLGGWFSSRIRTDIETSNDTISAYPMTHYSNPNNTSIRVLTLPAASGSDGWTLTFYVLDADGIRIDPAGSDQIRVGASISTATTGNVEATTIGNSITIVCINQVWCATSVVGTWTVN